LEADVIKLPKATPAPAVFKPKLVLAPYLYVLLLVFLATWQLMTFADFVEYVSGYLGGAVTSTTMFAAVLLVSLEILAVPFLMRLRLSPLARVCSATASLFVPIAWGVVTMANQTLFSVYVPVNLAFIAWAAVSFWTLGGQTALRVRL
jgi:hypothetical protein